MLIENTSLPHVVHHFISTFHQEIHRLVISCTLIYHSQQLLILMSKLPIQCVSQARNKPLAQQKLVEEMFLCLSSLTCVAHCNCRVWMSPLFPKLSKESASQSESSSPTNFKEDLLVRNKWTAFLYKNAFSFGLFCFVFYFFFWLLGELIKHNVFKVPLWSNYWVFYYYYYYYYY